MYINNFAKQLIWALTGCTLMIPCYSSSISSGNSINDATKITIEISSNKHSMKPCLLRKTPTCTLNLIYPANPYGKVTITNTSTNNFTLTNVNIGSFTNPILQSDVSVQQRINCDTLAPTGRCEIWLHLEYTGDASEEVNITSDQGVLGTIQLSVSSSTPPLR